MRCVSPHTHRMKSLRAKSFLGAVAVAALLPAVMAGSTAAAPDSTPYLWEVPGANAATLAAAGFDVDHGLVVGDDVVADRVRSLGYQVVRVDTVYKPCPPRRTVRPCRRSTAGITRSPSTRST
ncbi:hypothetical protein GCM10029964_058240 [Kibdelosporangium lantanae]